MLQVFGEQLKGLFSFLEEAVQFGKQQVGIVQKHHCF